MSYEDLKDGLRDVAFTTTTPFTEDGEAVHHDALTQNLQALESAGARLFIPCGNTGEYYALDHEERVNVVRTTTESVGDDSFVVAGAGGSTKTVQSLVSQYESLGVDGVLIMHPDHTYVHEKGLYEYYRRIADSTDLGIVLYKRGHDVNDELIANLSELENVVGVKYAVNDIEAFSRVTQSSAGDVVWSNGIAERFAPAFALEGAEGYTTGVGNFVPEATLALMEALRDGDLQEARRIRDLIRPFEDLREEPGSQNTIRAANNVPAVKYGQELADLYGGPVREPLVELSAEDKERAEEYYQNIQDAEL